MEETKRQQYLNDLKIRLQQHGIALFRHIDRKNNPDRFNKKILADLQDNALTDELRIELTDIEKRDFKIKYSMVIDATENEKKEWSINFTEYKIRSELGNKPKDYDYYQTIAIESKKLLDELNNSHYDVTFGISCGLSAGHWEYTYIRVINN